MNSASSCKNTVRALLGEGASVMEEGVAARVRRHGRGGWRREREGVGRERGERRGRGNCSSIA